jgi:hypothetical protein
MVGLPNEIARDSTRAPVWLVEMKAVQYRWYKHGDHCGTEPETVRVFTVLADGLLPDGVTSGAQFEITCIYATATSSPACEGTTD